jgi:hypothetical protein
MNKPEQITHEKTILLKPIVTRRGRNGSHEAPASHGVNESDNPPTPRAPKSYPRVEMPEQKQGFIKAKKHTMF